MIRKDYAFGLLFIFIGILFLFFNMSDLNFHWLLFILSIGIMMAYFIQGHIGYLISGLILFTISLVSLLNEYFNPDRDMKSLLFLWILGIISLVLYGRQRSKGYLIFGFFLPAIGTYNLVETMASGDISWALYLFFGISFYIIYIIGYREGEMKWAKYLAFIMIGLSILFLLSLGSIGQFKLWKFISYLWPILLIAIGIKTVYNRAKIKG